MITNMIHILAVLAMMEQGPNLAHNEHGAWCLKSSAIEDVHKLYPSITVEAVDHDPVAAQFCAEMYLRIIEKRLKKKLGRVPADGEIAGAFKAGVRGWMRGDGMGYATRFENLANETEGK